MTKKLFTHSDFDYLFLGNLTSRFVADVANFEGFRPNVYRCPSGVYTIGFGHTSNRLSKNTSVIFSLDTAKCILINDLNTCYKKLCSTSLPFTHFPTGLQLALIDFVFNCGIGTFLRSSMFRVLSKWSSTSSSDRILLYDRVCDHLVLYVYSNKKKLPGLVKRRKWEVSLIRGC